MIVRALFLCLCLTGLGFVRPAFGGTDLVSRVETAVEARRAALRHVSAEVVVRLDAPAWSGTGTCEGRLVAERPGSLRLRGYAAVSTVFDAVTDGTRFWVHVPGPNLLWVGPAGREAELVGLPVDPGTIVGARFGEPSGATGTPRAILGKPDWVAWDQADGAEVRTRWSGSPLRIQEAVLWSDGARVAKLAYHDWRKRRGTWWPTTIAFDGGSAGTVALEFTDVRFDRAPATGAFAPPEAADAHVFDLGLADLPAGDAR